MKGSILHEHLFLIRVEKCLSNIRISIIENDGKNIISHECTIEVIKYEHHSLHERSVGHTYELFLVFWVAAKFVHDFTYLFTRGEAGWSYLWYIILFGPRNDIIYAHINILILYRRECFESSFLEGVLTYESCEIRYLVIKSCLKLNSKHLIKSHHIFFCSWLHSFEINNISILYI